MYSGQIRPTVEYDRKIRYLDYMENGQRSRGAGFVKLERRDGHCNISLQISGLYRKDHFTRPLLLIGGGRERELCRLQLADGGLKIYLEKLDSHNLDGQGMDYGQLTGLRIPISEGKEIQCLWGESQTNGYRPAADRPQEHQDQKEMGRKQAEEYQDREEMGQKQAEERQDRGEMGQKRAEEYQDRGEMGRKQAEERQDREEMGQKQAEEYQDREEMGRKRAEERQDREEMGQKQAEERQDREEMGRKRAEEHRKPEIGGWQSESGDIPAVTAFKEDKWEQLWSIYPHVRPFSDEREYLTLGPGDFVMLPGRYYKLVNNSFLLHGYYNYHHLILTRVRYRDIVRYYIGVPGNLYQKEKKIAVMFGFEGFECACEPAGEGDFGYYLIPVEL